MKDLKSVLVDNAHPREMDQWNEIKDHWNEEMDHLALQNFEPTDRATGTVFIGGDFPLFA